MGDQKEDLMHQLRIYAQTVLVVGVVAMIVPVMVIAVAVGSRLSHDQSPSGPATLDTM